MPHILPKPVAIGTASVALAALVLLGLVRWAEGRVTTARPQPAAPGGGSTELVSGVFASGTGGSPMTSANYQMLAVIGEMGLPNNETTLTSQNYQHQPGFLASFNEAGGRVFMPGIQRNYLPLFAGPNEQEDNDTAAQANGALISGQDYTGQPNDQNDYFSFYAFGSGPISVDLSQITGDDIQLQLYAGSVSVGTLVTSDASQPYEIDHNGTGAGWYFVRIFVGGGTNSSSYTLRVTYP